jgi:hypothetical protein
VSKDDDELDLGSRSRLTRREIFDNAAQMRALREAFEAGGSAARAVIDSQAGALKEAYAEIARLHSMCGGAIDKSHELVGQLQHVASQNVNLTLAEANGRVEVAKVEQQGESLRHAVTLVATNPFLGVILKQVMPGIDLAGLLPPRPAGPGNTPVEAVQRLAASLRSGSEGSKILLDVLAQYCNEELQRPGDLALIIEYINEIAASATPGPAANGAAEVQAN